MKISYNWLLDYLTVKPSVAEVAEILTSVGLEVEGVEKYETLKGGLEGLVVGHVLELEKHPNADRLRVTKTDIGNGSVLQIVCGASNVAVGQKVIVATQDTVLYPLNSESITIKKSKIRGVESNGMICAEDEIGLSDNHDGIMVLDEKLTPGTPLREVFSVYTDYTIEVNITPNRGDAMSHIGMARDIACWYATHKKQRGVFCLPEYKFQNSGTSTFKVSIENTESCKRYSGVLIQNITVQESPVWLQNRLKTVGLKPINNIVDVTNYILYEYGQPLHAFDADRVNDKKVVVKNLPPDTSFITLDNKEIKLHPEDLMICDTQGGMCVAGVYGGLHSGVSAGTKNIFLESAWFHPVSIRKSAVRHQLRTDAAMRFEKQVNINDTVEVLKRAAALISEHGNGTISGDVIDVYPFKEEQRTISLRYLYLNALAGFDIQKEKADLILNELGFTVSTSNAEETVWLVPGYKNDCTIEEDLIEEVIRILGYDNIPITTSLKASISYTNEDSHRENFLRKMQTIAKGIGFTEVQNNSIYSAQLTEQLLPQHSEEIIRLMSYSNSGLDSLRTNMLLPLLNTVRNNLNRRELNLKLFEIGKTYSLVKGDYKEQQKICLLLTGNFEPEYWRSRNIASDLFQLKGFMDVILQRLGLSNIRQSEVQHTTFDYAITLEHKKQNLGVLGAVSSKWLQTFDIKQAVYYTEIDIETLLKLASEHVRFKEPSKYPAVRRDLALLLPAETPFAEIEHISRKNGGTNLRDVNLFDVYRDKKLGEGIKSYAVSFTFMDENKTLVDAEVDAHMQRLMTVFENELKASIRK